MEESIIFLVILLFLSAFFSATELAYVVSNKLAIEVKSKKGNIFAKNALFYLKNREDFFSILLIGNNIVNITFASVAAIVLYRTFELNEYQTLIISSAVLLMCGELIPKYFAREVPEFLYLTAALPIRLFGFIIFPVVKLTSNISRKITASQDEASKKYYDLFEIEDFTKLMKDGEEAGTVSEKESSMIRKVFELREQRVYESMRPRTEIVGVELDSPINDVIKTFISSGFSKLPVYEENLDNIKGVIFAYDVFSKPNSLNEILREALFVPETKKSIDMLEEFLSSGTSIAIVIDEHGGTAGLVTVEDIIEELFGEIKDEYDVDEVIYKKISDTEFIFSGKAEIDQINEKFGINLSIGDYETISGFISEKLGRIPEKGESFTIDSFFISVLKASKTKIDLIKLKVINE